LASSSQASFPAFVRRQANKLPPTKSLPVIFVFTAAPAWLTRNQKRENTMPNITEVKNRLGTQMSDRQRALLDAGTSLHETAKGLVKDAGGSLDLAGEQGMEALSNTARAGIEVAGGLVNVGSAAYETVKGTAQFGVGTAAGTAGVLAYVGEKLGNLLGRALQLLGVGIQETGDFARQVADRGGMQFTSKDIVGDKFAPMLSTALFNASADEFRSSMNSYGNAVTDLAGAAANGVMAVGYVAAAAANTTVAAGMILAAAVETGSAAAIEAASLAVKAASVAVEAADRGVDTAGLALQEAGKALVKAGNALNTARGTDTKVSVG
jgi:hypothetical protein